MSKNSSNTTTNRKYGRPMKCEAPRIPVEEVDRLLVFGEVISCENGETSTVRYPSYRELAKRYDVSHSVIANFSTEHNCMRRRDEARARIAAKADQKMVELRATAVALCKDDELRIIDGYLSGFEKALAEGRVRFDNPSDFNTMVRLKEFVQGGADSRQEIHAALSLEDIQARHKKMMKEVEETSAKERGEIGSIGAKALPEAVERFDSPKTPFEDEPQKMTGHFLNTSENDEEEA